MHTLKLTGLTFLLGAGLFDCSNKGDTDTAGEADTDTDTDTDSDTDADTDADTDTVGTEVTGTVSGTLRLQLYTEDEDGVREYLSWDEAYGGSYPFGSAFITAYTVGPSGGLDYPGTAVVSYEDIDLAAGNEYAIEVTVNTADELQLYAAIDYGRDTIISPIEPVGVYPAEIEVEDGETVDGYDITVLMPYYDFKTGEGGIGDGGLGNGSGCDDVTVSGDLIVDRNNALGLGVAMLIDSAGYGPYDYGFADVAPSGDEGISTGAYSFTTCFNYGAFQLRGAWDFNQNDLIDPADLWGSYADDSGADANPVTIATSDLIGYDIAIPLGEAGLTVIPFTELTGNLRISDGDFSDLPEGTSAIYVAAMKYRPGQDMSISYLEERSYDVVKIESDDFPSNGSLRYSLGVPSDSVMYLWSFADNDGDGILNESGEYIGTGGGANGQVITSEGTNSGYDISIGLAGG